jgi:hypothetical protein
LKSRPVSTLGAYTYSEKTGFKVCSFKFPTSTCCTAYGAADLLTPAAPHDGFLARALAAGVRREGGATLSLPPVDFRVQPLGGGGASAVDLPMEGPPTPGGGASTSSSKDDDDDTFAGGGGGGGALMGASIAQPHDVRAREWLAAATGKSAPDAAVTARRWLTDVLRQERLTPPVGLPQAKKGVAVTAAELTGRFVTPLPGVRLFTGTTLAVTDLRFNFRITS